MQKEVITALRKLSHFKVVALQISSHPTREQAQYACDLILNQNCALLFTINEWGLDTEGIISALLSKKQIIHVNWCVDDPFYEQLILTQKFIPSPNRIDFVSDKDYLNDMNSQGYNAHFLPLATDPSLFFPPPKQHYLHDASFVGNSYTSQLNEFIGIAEDFVHSMIPYINIVLQQYYMQNDLNIEEIFKKKLSTIALPSDISLQKAVFIFKHIAGYLYRKRVVTSLADSIDSFAVYGDQHWEPQVKTKLKGTVNYGEQLRTVYHTSKINIDINRVVIRNGFTQRIFDVLACKSFIITSAKPIINDFFDTDKNAEIITFTDPEQLKDSVKYFLHHDSERESIASRGYQKILAAHTYTHRMQQMFQILRSNLL